MWYASVCFSCRLTATEKHNSYATHFTTKIMCTCKIIMHNRPVARNFNWPAAYV